MHQSAKTLTVISSLCNICFWGGIGNQSILHDTTPEFVSKNVREVAAIMGAGGGWIASPCHTITPEIATENVLAFYEALK